MASKAPRARAYQPRRDRKSRRRRDRRMIQPVPTLAALLTVIPSLSRPELGRLVQRMIDHMDAMDGDTDLGPNGDELDGSMGEDDFCVHKTYMAGPGCPVSDPGGGNVEDEGQINEVMPYTGPIGVSAARAATSIMQSALAHP
ncbi:hypothetical protein VVT58_01935 [Sphingobium sp. SJ10-10]|uniref:hypothetical protein n=1 Tax=Sphingobium sp. SJ10-10 TaxID=3114999 RepID=UPI002E1944B3|nr:hypothetical protein [Sphingobium sp. SJ10-10]